MVKDIQKLTGRVAALNRFISRSSERWKSFYNLLRKNKDFQWTPDHQSAFEELKAYLSSPPLLEKPVKDEPLTVYLSVTEIAFVGKRTTAFCAQWNINLVTSTPGYPKANGQASSNKVIISYLKKKLKRKKGRWAEELPLVLWADRTTPKTSTGQTPYSLVYGCEAVILAEIDIPSARCSLNTVADTAPLMEDSLNLTEELRDASNIRMAAYQQTKAKSYNKTVKARVFRIGDLVLRKVFENIKEKNAGKLAPTWKGLYLIDSIVGQGAYRLQTLDGEMIPRAWNIAHLKLFHI
ncbi:uncharacterized protein LOC141635035 [Silene latifolia]|uniref:uncharacterized protein LOC141635035 n=1 Tax=Silene latifolia TaxID=37657 RepID=UPI003D78297A